MVHKGQRVKVLINIIIIMVDEVLLIVERDIGLPNSMLRAKII
jgi:hypothetical protein